METIELAWYMLLLACWIAIAAFDIVTFGRYWRCCQPDPANSSIGALGSLEFLAVLAIQAGSVVWAVSLVPWGPARALAASYTISLKYFYGAVVLPVSGLLWLSFRHLEHTPLTRWQSGQPDVDALRDLWLVQFLLWFVPLTAAFVMLGGFARG
jgi:hypothetical protein